MNRLWSAVLAVVVVVVAILGWQYMRPDPEPAKPAYSVDVKVPELEGVAAEGEVLFAQYCTVCHGENAAGTDKGPPLIHKIYEPSHHGDMSIAVAARNGVRAHHWRFGNMPPVEGVTNEDIAKIIRYIRDVQRANGIY